MQIRELHSLDALEGIREPWRELIEGSAWDSPYLTPEFLLPWIRLTGDMYAMRVLTAWEGERLLGLAPLFDRRLGRGPVSLRRRSFPIHGQSPPLDVVTAERRGEVMAAFLGHWAADPWWEVLELRDVPAESDTEALLGGLGAEARLRLRRDGERRTDCLAIRGSWQDYLATQSRKSRKNFNNLLNRCQRIGETRFLEHPGELEYPEALKRLGDVIRRSWKSGGGEDERFSRFLAELTAELRDAGRLRLRFLEVAGASLAAVIEIEFKASVHAYYVAYDIDHQALGPGWLTLREGMRQAHERGCRRYDFGNTTSQTQRWANERSAFHTLQLVRPGWLPRAKTGLYGRLRTRRQEREEREAEAGRVARMRERR